MSKANAWLEKRLDTLEEKMDKIQTEIVPALLVEVARITTAESTKTKQAAKFYGWIMGGITMVISLTSIAIAYFK